MAAAIALRDVIAATIGAYTPINNIPIPNHEFEGVDIPPLNNTETPSSTTPITTNKETNPSPPSLKANL
jgi:hypothetical protein